MSKNILVIGGTRYFGKLLVQDLLDAGHQITIATRGNAADQFGAQVKRIKVDRRDEAAMHAAFVDIDGYDLVYDQMCYSPLDAAISVKVFAGKVKRYVMSSTIEVYRASIGQQDHPFAESDWNPAEQTIDPHYPWHDPALAEESYAAGKRQAEAFLYGDGSLPLVTVRIGHVLGGPEDFTGRLAHYVELARSKTPLRYSHAADVSSFLNPQQISDFLVWVGVQDFVGPINAACDGPLSVLDLYHGVGAALGVEVKTVVEPDSAAGLSPFDYSGPYAMDTGRARALGYRFSHVNEWLSSLVRQHLQASA
jgi:nucleoside-diphosphate-sugar epimerase